MLYDSLLLLHGSMLPDNSKASQNNTAALVIGIGGNGIAALSKLKGNIYRQLQPDNPGDAVPRYDGIQLLGIDSDEEDYRKYRGNCRLRTDEFFSICNPHLAAALRDKKQIRDDPLLNWMEIDNISNMLAPEGAGCVRQVGRYLLTSKVSPLETVIQSKCALAMRSRGTESLDVHIFAGMAGGTGSGCFLDTCYIVRQIAKNNGWNVKLFGYFFLPDVVFAKPEIVHNPGMRRYLEVNGYAAMKELDHLMQLRDTEDRFDHTYSSTLIVDTQEPPVDMCHLISCCQPNGTIPPLGYEHSIAQVADYVLSFLADTQNAYDPTTMRAQLLYLTHAQCVNPDPRGAFQGYTYLNTAAARFPKEELSTYLACGFFNRFHTLAQPNEVVTKKHIADFVQRTKLTLEDILRQLSQDMPTLFMPALDPRALSRCSRPAPGYLPDDWAVAGNEWLDRCSALLCANSHQLGQNLDSYDYHSCPKSLLGNIFRQLLIDCMDPQRGPYYAARILHNGSHDLTTEIDGAIETTEQRLSVEEMYFRDAKKNLESCKDAFYSNFGHFFVKRRYQEYSLASQEYFRHVYQIQLLKQCIDLLRRIRSALDRLYQDYFRPLYNTLQNLVETFQENRQFLDLPEDYTSLPGRQSILPMQALKAKLDARIQALTPKELVTDFLEALAESPEDWCMGDEGKIAQRIRQLMYRQFQLEMTQTLDDLIRENQLDPNEMIQQTVAQLVPHPYLVPTFDPGHVYVRELLNVPAGATLLQPALEYYEKANPCHRASLHTGLDSGLLAVRLYTCIPMYASSAIANSRYFYEQCKDLYTGIHLYANTGRGSNGSGTKNWYALPDPIQPD